MNTLQEFLNSVITTPNGYLELGIRNGVYRQEWYEWPNDLELVCEVATKASEHGDVYFSSHLFKSKNSHKDNVLPTRTIQQDLDDADVSKLQLAPTILNSTSPHRHQGFWVLQNDLTTTLEELEELSKRVAYNIPLCDHSGWPLGHKMRLPFTKNYKYKDGPFDVQVVRVTGKRYTLVDLQEMLGSRQPGSDIPNLSAETLEEHRSFIEVPPMSPAEASIGVYEIMESIKDKVSSKVYGEYMQDTPQIDRSSSLFALETQLFRAGLSREEVYWVAYKSPNNKFHADLRFNADRELAKDVVRAERAVSSLPQNIKDMINLIRKQTKTLMSERRKQITDIVLQAMRGMGDFINLEDERRYYVPRLSGRPMEVEAHTDQLHSLLDVEFGLNQTETEHQYVVRSLMAYTSTIPMTARPAALSYFDKEERRLLVHSGRKSVYSIDQDGVKTIDNGSYNVLFPWQLSWEPIVPDLDPNHYVDWGTMLYTVPNVINMSPEEAKCILKVFTIFLLLREAITTKPLLAFLGQPGSGKTSVASKIYLLLYGRRLAVSSPTTPVDYDVSTAAFPFYALDNVDTWEPWLPNRLALSARRSDVSVRKLYTNDQVILIKRQALVCVTAHDPKFGRADVTDRLLIIMLQRFSNMGIPFLDEQEIVDTIMRNRARLWGSIIRDIQRVFSNPIPESTDIQLRIQDFARLGEWIALGLGEQDLFREAVGSVVAAQRSFNLDEDHILISSIQRWLARSNYAPAAKTQDELYREVMSLVTPEDIKTFQLLYKNSSTFCRRISTLQDTLNNTLFTVDMTGTDKKGQKLWLIRPKLEQ